VNLTVHKDVIECKLIAQWFLKENC